MSQRISTTAARAVLKELQEVADDRARLIKGPIDDGTFARIVLASLIGGLEARLPRAEWNRVDVFRLKRAAG